MTWSRRAGVIDLRDGPRFNVSPWRSPQSLGTVGCVDQPDTPNAPTKRLKSFRVGLLRTGSIDFKPVAHVGLAKDGGIFVIPAQVADFGWTYGVHDAPPEENVTIDVRPKLHYHRSGLAFPTLSGKVIERRSATLPQLPLVAGRQVLSVTCERPWALQSKALRLKSDVTPLVRTWPQTVAFSISLLSATPEDQRFIAGLVPDAGIGVAVVDGYSAAVVPLAAYGHQTVLAVQTGMDFKPAAPQPGTAVWAFHAEAPPPVNVVDGVGLWSSSLRHPSLWMAPNKVVNLRSGSLARKHERRSTDVGPPLFTGETRRHRSGDN